MTWNPRPVPDVTPETEPYWTAAADERLLIRECSDCGLIFHYPRALCPDCLGDDVSWVRAAGTGTIYSYSVTDHVEGWPEEYLPLVLAYVELEDGPRVMTNIVRTAPEDLVVGTEVTVEFEQVEDEDIAVPVWTVE